MHELYELKEKLCDELKEYGSKGDLTAGSLEVVDKLAHAVKNLDKIIEAYEDEDGYSEGWMPRYYYNDGSYADGRGTTNRGGNRGYRGRSYARRRDSMGRYSRDDKMISELHRLMEDAPDEKTRNEFHRFIQKIEQM